MMPFLSMPLELLGLAAAAIGLLVLAMADGGGKRRLARRARLIGANNRLGRRPVTGPQLRRDRPGSGLDAFLYSILPRPAALRARLGATGSGLTISRFMTICFGLTAFLIAALLTFGMAPVAAVLVALPIGLWIPHMIVGRLIGRRRERFAKLFPQAIGLIVRGIKAGIPVTEALQIVGREIKDPVGEEFRRVSDQIRLGQSIEDAMWTIAKRLNLAEFSFLVITLSVQRETGGNLAETLENLEDILRRRQQMRLKIKAMSSEAMSSAAIVGSLPFVMMALLYVLNRDYLMVLFTSNKGYIMCGGGALWMAIGAFVMSRMVKFEI